MRASVVLGAVLIVVGIAVAFVALGSHCYTTVIPGLAPSGPSCNETVLFGAAGLILFVLGIVLVFLGRRKLGSGV